jgi:hypothetical protein
MTVLSESMYAGAYAASACPKPCAHLNCGDVQNSCYQMKCGNTFGPEIAKCQGMMGGGMMMSGGQNTAGGISDFFTRLSTGIGQFFTNTAQGTGNMLSAAGQGAGKGLGGLGGALGGNILGIPIILVAAGVILFLVIKKH